jgi:hypothetical protein
MTQLATPAPPRDAAPALGEPAIELPLRESFTVQDAGEAPRQRYRYQLAAPARRYALTATLRARALTEETPADAAAAAVPPFRESFVVEPAPGGRLYWLGEPPHVEAASEAEAATAAPYVQRWKALLAGRRATFELDERAMPERLTFAEDPLGTASRPERDELAQRLLGLAVPLPAEPIGRGARWTAVTVLRQGLGVVKQTARYRLLEAGDGRLEIAVELRRVGEEQRISSAELPAGAVMELVAMFREVAGEVELDLTAPLPIAGALTLEARTHQRLRLPDQPASEVITEDTGALQLTSAPARP